MLVFSSRSLDEWKLGDARSGVEASVPRRFVEARLDTLISQAILHTHATGVGPTGPAIGILPRVGGVGATKVKAK